VGWPSPVAGTSRNRRLNPFGISRLPPSFSALSYRMGEPTKVRFIHARRQLVKSRTPRDRYSSFVSTWISIER
jgi:hypothetical protein